MIPSPLLSSAALPNLDGDVEMEDQDLIAKMAIFKMQGEAEAAHEYGDGGRYEWQDTNGAFTSMEAFLG
jgi:hypothetical protein